MSYLTEKILNDINDDFFSIAQELGIHDADIKKDEIIVDQNTLVIPFSYNSSKSKEKYSDQRNLAEGNVYFIGEKNVIDDLNSMFYLKMKAYPVKFEAYDVFYDNYENKETAYQRIINDRKKMIQNYKEELSLSEEENLINSTKAKLKFSELGSLQRDKPEMKMLECQHNLYGGVLPTLLEHIGDLTHRMSEEVFSHNGNIEGTINQVLPKVKRGINYLTSPYGFEREHNENLENNYEALKERNKLTISFDEWKNKIEQLLKEYSEEHEKLPVYNDAQFSAREAAIGLGRMDFDYSLKHLQYLEKIIENGEYIKIASLFNEDYEGYKNKNLNKRKNKP